ncbi:hypothetical protein Moror_3810 [Moniliophthora roreri MCA 2997]|uniref:Uncharacterized protein n=1 Tax=Moniliophthora roreri (strain MCA 2997) TaxID=1381753 RepID=V2XXW8_MONRO|nr:hypothetical protein Moror_3810 [Moniliophthora roreri MCA 2997]KAI3602563.1 hypothetical protein WG66_009223 [Moniliophthora roreri]
MFERCLYIGNTFAGIIYGFELCLAFKTIYLLLRDQSQARGHKIFFISYIMVILLVQSLAVASNVAAGQLMWIEHRDFPGGPIGYHFATSTKSWNNFTGIGSVELSVFLGNLLLLYRCYVIWGSLPVMILPTILFLTSSAMAIMAIIQSAGTSVFAHRAANYIVLWVAFLSSLNVLLTCLISFRLIMARRRLRKLGMLAPKQYTSIVAILVESSLLFTVFGVIFAVLLGKGVTVYTIFSVFAGLSAGISPMLIIYRVARGTAWSGDHSTVIFTDLKVAVGRTTVSDPDLDRMESGDRALTSTDNSTHS